MVLLLLNLSGMGGQEWEYLEDIIGFLIGDTGKMLIPDVMPDFLLP